jgi:hypothetical protein
MAIRSRRPHRAGEITVLLLKDSGRVIAGNADQEICLSSNKCIELYMMICLQILQRSDYARSLVS